MKVVWGNNANETRGKRFTSILIAALLCIIVFVPVAALALAEEQGDTPDALPQAEESEAAALPLDEEPGDEAAALPLEEETIVKAEAAPVKKQAMLRTSYAIDLSAITGSGGGDGYTYNTSSIPKELKFTTEANNNEYVITQSGSTAIEKITVGETGATVETKITISGINVSSSHTNNAVFDVLPGAKVTLILEEDNYLTKDKDQINAIKNG
ncbi:MAG: hypothetical protein LBC58_05260, partial [Clostridiales Family XIII bacterium]|nr:hypothetical protein [Clostridiales Family XIII bacterium]